MASERHHSISGDLGADGEPPRSPSPSLASQSARDSRVKDYKHGNESVLFKDLLKPAHVDKGKGRQLFSGSSSDNLSLQTARTVCPQINHKIKALYNHIFRISHVCQRMNFVKILGRVGLNEERVLCFLPKHIVGASPVLLTITDPRKLVIWMLNMIR